MGRPAITQAAAEERMRAIPDKEFIGWEDGFSKGMKSFAVMTCKARGHEWSACAMRLHKGSGCPMCQPINKTIDRLEMEGKLRKLIGIEIIGWVGGYSGATSRIRVKCKLDGREWETGANRLVDEKNGTGCPDCGRRLVESARRVGQEEMERRILALSHVKFLGWEGEFVNSDSRARFSCVREDCECEWVAIADNVIRVSGCPNCAEYGFNPGAEGFVYALISDCGKYIKIGITKDIDKRVATLKSATPFEFKLLSKKHFASGSDASKLERWFHANFKRAMLGLHFQGYTEWLSATDELLKAISDKF
ncbi:putative endonuclease [Aeromonas phage Gekk3-15]